MDAEHIQQLLSATKGDDSSETRDATEEFDIDEIETALQLLQNDIANSPSPPDQEQFPADSADALIAALAPHSDLASSICEQATVGKQESAVNSSSTSRSNTPLHSSHHGEPITHTRPKTPPSSAQPNGRILPTANQQKSVVTEDSFSNADIDAVLAQLSVPQLPQPSQPARAPPSRSLGRSPISKRAVRAPQNGGDDDIGILEKVREENRERKKKWRIRNQDRNKDNDLRCRVHKRALSMFGEDNTEEKMNWMKKEFEERRLKRERKERSRTDDPETSIGAGSSSVFPATIPSSRPVSSQPMHKGFTHPNTQLTELLTLCGVSGPVTPETINHISNQITQNPLLRQRFHQLLENLPGPIGHLPAVGGNVPSGSTPDVSLITQTVTSGQSGHGNVNSGQGFATSSTNDESSDELLVEDNILAVLQKFEADATNSEATSNLLDFNKLLATFQQSTSYSQDPQLVEVSELIPQNPQTEEDGARNSEEASETLPGNNVIDMDTMDIEDLDVLERLLQIPSEEPISLDTDGQIADDNAESTIKTETSLSEEPPATSDELENVEDVEGMEGANNMSEEELNRLIQELGGDADGTTSPDAQSITDVPSSQMSVIDSQQTQAAPYSSPTPLSSTSPTQTGFGNDQDTSSLYTPETVGAIISALVEAEWECSERTPALPFTISRGIKRSSSARYSQPAKRHRSHPPAPHQAQLGMYGTGVIGTKLTNQPMDHSRVSSAYAASFGNSDTMNKRLIALKPAPYRPGGGSSGLAASSLSGAPIISAAAKKKNGEDEKKIKAMGFPPLLGGITKKT